MPVLSGTPFATGSEIRNAYVAETSYGIVPTSPVFTTLRTTGGPGLRTNKVTGTSDEIQPDRNIRDEFQLGQDVTGSYPAELTYASFDDWFEAALMGTWTNNALQNASARRSFTVEQTYEPNGQTLAIHRFAGCKVDGFALSLTARQKAMLTWTLMGQREVDDTGPVAGATYTPSATSPVMTASGSVAALAFSDGATAPVRKVDITQTNHLYTRPEVGTLYSGEMGEGRFDVTGTFEVYFQDNSAYAAALAHQNATLSFTIGNAVGQRYTFNLPNIKLGNMDVPEVGNDQDVILTLPFRALYDPTTGATLIITRAV